LPALRSCFGLGFLLLALVACPATDPTIGLSTGTSQSLLDYNAFVCDAMPTLIRRCSYLACHGNVDHGFRVYAPGKLRVGDPTTREGRDAPLTADEIDSKFQSAVGMTRAANATERDQANAGKIPLLEKPLAARFGGAEHHGVAVFPVYPKVAPEDDPEWLLLVNWVGGSKEASPPPKACADFFAALGAPPR